MKKSALSLCFFALAALPAAATQLYTNGPVNGNLSAWAINFSSATEDSFTLTQASWLSSATFYVWEFPGDTMSSVDWGIDTVPTSYANPTTATTTQTLLFNNGSFDIDKETISLSGAYAPGTYYFFLENAVVSNGDTTWWDINNGPSTAFVNDFGDVNGVLFRGTNSNAFAIDGSPLSAVPEPSSLLLLGSGLAAFTARMRRRVRN